MEEFEKYKKMFSKLYEIRANILHGKSYLMKDSKENINQLTISSQLLRLLWVKILTNPSMISILEKNDTERNTWFNNKHALIKEQFTQLKKPYHK